VIVEDGKVIGTSKTRTGGATKAARIRDAVKDAEKAAGVSLGETDKIFVTGKGKQEIEADKQVTEPKAAVKGVLAVYPDATMVVSVGADETIVATITKEGAIGEFTLNQKCAAGLGLFLEAVADRLEIGIEELAALSLKKGDEGDAAGRINDGCVVFSELDVLSMLNRGISLDTIAVAVCDAIVARASTTINDITLPDTEQVVLIGGVAKNKAFAEALSKRSGIAFRIPDQPEYVSAIGAASA
jgi:benzoyl-CoA reductase subunit D